MKKRIMFDSSPVLYDQPITMESLQTDWTIHKSEWRVEDGWLQGKNSDNWPGRAIMKENFPGNVFIGFDASTILPSTHDINVMWKGEWFTGEDHRGEEYVEGLEGWWIGKIDIKKSPDYKFMTGTPLLKLEQGKVYHIEAGSIDGHCIIFADGNLLLETMDPDPIDNQKHTKVGFEAYASTIHIKSITIQQVHCKPVDMNSDPEF
jgi:hypothetical protein